MQDKPSRLILTLGIAILFGAVIWHAYQFVVTPFTLDYAEGNVLNAAARILRGASPYPRPGSMPYVLDPYGPVGYYTIAGAMRLLGVSFLAGRLFILACAIAVCVLAAILIHRYLRSWFAAVLFAVLWLCTPVAAYWAGLLRVDIIAVLFTMLGLVLFRPNARDITLASIAFVVGIYAKQTTVAAPAACFVYLLISKQRKLATLLAVEVGGLGLAALALGQYWSHGTLWFHLVGTQRDSYVALRVLQIYVSALISVASILAMCLIAIAGSRRTVRRFPLPFLYLGMTALTGVVAAKFGSNTNYMLEFAVALCIVAAIAFSDLQVREKQIARIFAALIIFQLGMSAFGGITTWRQWRASNYGPCSESYAYIASFRGQPVLSEDVGALVAGRDDVLLSDPFVYKNMRDYVKWDAGPVEQWIAQRRVALVVLGTPPFARQRWPEEFLSELGKNYVPAKSLRCSNMNWQAYVPKQAGSSQAVAAAPLQVGPGLAAGK